MSGSDIRVRIAPSPSGYLHVGTARTAIFNWLFARKNNGRFIVRIEDTDVERSRPELIEPILEDLKWLGLDWDEEPYFQSKRLDRYKPYTQRLLESGHAYRCFCTPEELEQARRKAAAEKLPSRFSCRCRDMDVEKVSKSLDAGKPFALRLKIPDGVTSYDDIILGPIARQHSEIEDLVIRRSDGSAVYNMAVVVDDHEMGITHVIRGNDHINNTFKQILIYRALGLDPPQFAHVPLILRPDKRKISKRLGDKDVAKYGKEGILPEALFNFLCLLGWSPKDDREYLSREELVRIFTLENVNPSNPIFSEEKLLALNGEYIRNTPDHKLAEMVTPLLANAGDTTKYRLESRWDYLLAIIRMLKERCTRLTDFVAKSEYFFRSEFSYDPKAVKRQFTQENKDNLARLKKRFERLDKFTKDDIENALNEIAEELGVKRGKLIHPVRLAVSGVTEGPGLFDIVETIGKKETIERMDRAIKYIEKLGGEDDG
jgi:glutamyl-tRNA synthetase